MAQDVFVKAFRKIDSLKAPSKFRSWICKIALNMALNKHKSERPIPLQFNQIDEAINEHEMNSALETLEAESRRALIQHGLAALPPDDRILLQLYYLQELKLKEIAEITGFSPSNVRSNSTG